jgi:hypothetical protein
VVFPEQIPVDNPGSVGDGVVGDGVGDGVVGDDVGVGAGVITFCQQVAPTLLELRNRSVVPENTFFILAWFWPHSMLQ